MQDSYYQKINNPFSQNQEREYLLLNILSIKKGAKRPFSLHLNYYDYLIIILSDSVNESPLILTI